MNAEVISLIALAFLLMSPYIGMLWIERKLHESTKHDIERLVRLNEFASMRNEQASAQFARVSEQFARKAKRKNDEYYLDDEADRPGVE